MAKLEKTIKNKNSFQNTVSNITNKVLKASASSSLEESIDVTIGDVDCAIRTIERYSVMGENRVSMNIVFLCQKESNETKIIATCTGGGKGLIKIIPWGEQEFLNTLMIALEK